MSMHRLIFVILATVLATPFSALGAGLKVLLAPPQQIVARGQTPRFVVTIQAVETEQRVLKFNTRRSLRDNYAKLIISREGKLIDTPRAISDPGPTSESDYMKLGAGEAFSFEHDGQPLALTGLAPGNYSALIKLWSDWRSAPVLSNSVSFTIGE